MANMTAFEASVSYKQLIIGLPEAGKTTFLAALWHVVTSKEVDGSLRLNKLEGDRRHLNKIRKAWLEYDKVGRTIPATEEIVSMNLGLPGESQSVTLIFPDMSGESFRQQWVERKWSKEYDDLVNDASGILLFVHSLKVIGPDRIDPVVDEAVFALADDEDIEDEARAVDDEDLLPGWSAEKSPTHVQLMELIQFIEHQPQLDRINRIAVIVSAWDLVMDKYGTPDEWLSRRLPLLDQYLKANFERFSSRIYGVSAQGVIYGHDENGNPLDKNLRSVQEFDCQSERIIVVGQGCAPHDITAPAKWLIGIG